MTVLHGEQYGGDLQTAPGGVVLAARNLTCGYGGQPVLRGVGIELAPGEMVALLGRNGSGKSTLLRCLAGAISPLAGSVYLDGVPLARLERRAAARLLAVVPQELHIPFAFSAREVVELGRAPHARFLAPPDRADARAVAAALAACDLDDLADRPYQQLSGGEQQRVILAMALAQEPRVLLLDEPTVHLDLAHQLAFLALARRLCAEHGLAMLAAMHDLNLAALTCERLLMLGEGTLLASGTAHDVIMPALIARAFGLEVAVTQHPGRDVPQINLLP